MKIELVLPSSASIHLSFKSASQRLRVLEPHNTPVARQHFIRDQSSHLSAIKSQAHSACTQPVKRTVQARTVTTPPPTHTHLTYINNNAFSAAVTKG